MDASDSTVLTGAGLSNDMVEALDHAYILIMSILILLMQVRISRTGTRVLGTVIHRNMSNRAETGFCSLGSRCWKLEQLIWRILPPFY